MTIVLEDEDHRALVGQAVANARQAERYRSALCWVLWHHQGFSSPIGQPLRAVFGLKRGDRLPNEIVTTAKKFGDRITGLLRADVDAEAKLVHLIDGRSVQTLPSA
jgi:hypothetical protein